MNSVVIPEGAAALMMSRNAGDPGFPAQGRE